VSLDNYEVVLGNFDNQEELEYAFADLMRPEVFNSNMDFSLYKDN